MRQAFRPALGVSDQEVVANLPAQEDCEQEHHPQALEKKQVKDSL